MIIYFLLFIVLIYIINENENDTVKSIITSIKNNDIVKCLTSKENFTTEDLEEPEEPDIGNFDIKVQKSPISGLGVFATRDYTKDEIIEICPYLQDTCKTIVVGKLKDYIFSADQYNGLKDCGMSLGYCPLYNHADKNKAFWHVNQENKLIYIIALTDITEGDEITINYGEPYWEKRKEQKNS